MDLTDRILALLAAGPLTTSKLLDQLHPFAPTSTHTLYRALRQLRAAGLVLRPDRVGLTTGQGGRAGLPWSLADAPPPSGEATFAGATNPATNPPEAVQLTPPDAGGVSCADTTVSGPPKGGALNLRSFFLFTPERETEKNPPKEGGDFFATNPSSLPSRPDPLKEGPKKGPSSPQDASNGAGGSSTHPGVESPFLGPLDPEKVRVLRCTRAYEVAVHEAFPGRGYPIRLRPG